MSMPLDGIRVAILATDGVEQVELEEPRKALDAAGATTVLVGPKAGKIQGFNGPEKADRFAVDLSLEDAHAADFSALVLPGGVANPDALRTDEKAVQFVREFMVADKPVAAICHAPWLLIEADAVAGRRLTSWPSLRADIRNAGGEWTDTEVVVDDRLITSRKPADLDAFCSAIVREFGNRIADDRMDQVSEQSFPASDPPPGPSTIGGVDRTAAGKRPEPDSRP